MLNQLNYSKILGNNAELLFDKIHSAQWGRGETITSSFLLKKMVADFTDIEFEHLYDLVYFDAFAPDKQPEMWLLENFRKLYGCLNQNGVLVTYSAKGIIKRRLAEAGFSVSTISGPPGKREMIRAEKR
jgi:tRNA U34 5-methylaminomethyl-2-thiouridine-forming methyltransferase MnmC